ncbi:hypothetical protein XANCAGTX0491_004715 [Xanthoria calcicola]
MIRGFEPAILAHGPLWSAKADTSSTASSSTQDRIRVEGTMTSFLCSTSQPPTAIQISTEISIVNSLNNDPKCQPILDPAPAHLPALPTTQHTVPSHPRPIEPPAPPGLPRPQKPSTKLIQQTPYCTSEALLHAYSCTFRTWAMRIAFYTGVFSHIVADEALLGLGITFLPDSPRYFVKRGKLDKAADSLARLRGQPVNSDYVQHELAEIVANGIRAAGGSSG